MTFAYLKTPVGIGKLGAVLFSLLVMSVAINSHYGSDWMKPYFKDSHPKDLRKLHEWCEQFPDFGMREDPNCPPIEFERLLIGVSIIALILTFVSLILTLIGKDKSSFPAVKWIDIAVFLLLAVLLIVAASLYIVSTERIKNIFVDNTIDVETSGLNRGYKIAGAILALLQAGVFCGVAVLILRNED